MKISILSTSYNNDKTIRDMLESVLCQTWQDYELVIKDGGSTDSTISIIQSYLSAFGGKLLLISEPDEGIYDAMNKALEKAHGDVVGILGANDMLYDKDVLADIAQAFETYGVECVYGDLDFVNPYNTKEVVRKWKGSQYKEGIFAEGWAPAHPTFYVKRECYEKYGVYRTGIEVSADFDLMLRFLEKHKISNRHIDRLFVKMRYGGASNGSLWNVIKGNMGIALAFKQNGLKRKRFYFFKRNAPKLLNLIRTKYFNKEYTAEIDKNDYVLDGMTMMGDCIKRALDIIVSLLGLVASSPLFLLCYLAIKMDDGGPAIFQQERIGRGGKPFTIYKFRSMKVDAEKDGPALYQHSREIRMTRIGSFLRTHHLDELPQLWNVLRGDMSLVGPRPERKYYIDQILEHDPRYIFIYQVRPGVTSYATLYNGYTDTMEKMLRRLELDLYYLKHRSLWFEAKLLLFTFINMATGKKF